MNRAAIAVIVLLGCAFLTGARIPVFSSDVTLWLDAWPSSAPRVAVNIASAYLQAGEWAQAGPWSLRADDLAYRPESTYERGAVRKIVRLQIQYLNAWSPVCQRPAYSPFC